MYLKYNKFLKCFSVKQESLINTMHQENDELSSLINEPQVHNMVSL